MAQARDKRAAILDAATAEFKEYGFQAANMDRIAARAPASKRTVYKHFESKRALLEEISSQLVERAAEASERPYRADEDPREALEQIAHSLLDLYLDPGFLSTARMMLSEYFRLPDLARTTLEKARAGEDGVTRWIRQAQAGGQLALADPVRAASQLTGLLKTSTFWHYVFAPDETLPDDRERNEIVSETVTMFLLRYGA